MGTLGEGDAAPGQALNMPGGNELQHVPLAITGGQQAPQIPGAGLDHPIGRIGFLSAGFGIEHGSARGAEGCERFVVAWASDNFPAPIFQ